MRSWRWLRRITVIGLVAFVNSSQGQAQQTDYTFALGVLVGNERPRGPRLQGGCFGGVSAGLERQFGSRVSMRGSGTLAAPCDKGDDISVCYPSPPGSAEPCLAKPGYAGRYGILTLTGLVQPVEWLPVQLLASAGWSALSKAGGPTPVPASRPLWQWGGSFVWGRSPRSPRIDVTETRFTSPVGNIKRLIGVQVWLRW